ncbi:hypothetical protein D9M68_847590 [compost metagenome]
MSLSVPAPLATMRTSPAAATVLPRPLFTVSVLSLRLLLLPRLKSMVMLAIFSGAATSSATWLAVL